MAGAAVPYYAVTFEADETGYVMARFADWPYIITGGETLAEAMANAEEALAATIAYYLEVGMTLPQPLAEHSGQINLRVPKSLHRQLKQRAAAEGVSLNALVNHLLAGAVG
jgi:predicted RNase H-like HicB family nuclease